MAPVEVAQAPPPDEFNSGGTAVETENTASGVAATTSNTATAPPEQLTIEQTLRIMDVATTLRKEQAVVHQQLNLEQTKAMLRQRLLEAAQVTGEALTVEQVDLAIEHYYDKLHVFEEPEWSLELALAHLYVMRNSIIKWTLAIGATAGILTWLW